MEIVDSPKVAFEDVGRKSTDTEISASSPETHPDSSSFKSIEHNIDDPSNQIDPFKQNLPSISKINEIEEIKLETELTATMTQELQRDSITITNIAKEGVDIVDIELIKEPEGEPHIATTISTGNDSIDSMIRKLSLPASLNKNENKTLKTRFRPKSSSKHETHKFVDRYKSTSSDDDQNENDNDGSTDREIKEKEASETNSNLKSSNSKTKSKRNQFRCTKNYKSSSSEQSSTEIMKQEDYHSSSGSLSYFESITQLTTMTNIANSNSTKENINKIEKQSSEQTISQLSPAGGVIEPNTPCNNKRASLLIAQTSPSDCTTTSLLSSRLSLRFNQTSSNKAVRPKSLVSIPSNVKQYKQYKYHRAHNSVENPFYHSDQEHDAGDEQDDDDDDNQVQLTHIITNDILNDDINDIMMKRTKEGCTDETNSDDTFVDDEDSMVTDDESYSSYNWYQSFNRASNEKAIGHNITKMVRKVTAGDNSIIIKGIKTGLHQHTTTSSIDSMDSADSGDSNIVHFDSTEARNVRLNTPNSALTPNSVIMTDIKIPRIKQYSSTDITAINKRVRFRNNDITPRDSITRSLSMLPGLCGIPSKTPTNYAIHPRSKTYTPSFTNNGNLNLLAYYPKSNDASCSSYNSSMQAQSSSMQVPITSISSIETDDNVKMMLFKEPTPKDNDNVASQDSINVNVDNSASDKSVIFVTTPGDINGDDNKPYCAPPPIYPPPLNTPINSSEDIETDNDGTPSTIEYNGVNCGPPLPLKWIQNSATNSPYYQYTHYNYYYFDDSDKQKCRQIPLQRPCPPPHTFNYYSNNKSDFDEDNDETTPTNS